LSGRGSEQSLLPGQRHFGGEFDGKRRKCLLVKIIVE
jgi:hypothetical protein